MTQIEGHFKRDANGVPIASHGLVETKSVVFAGGTANNMGDYDGTGNPYTLFTVTGDVLVQIFGSCTVNLAGASATLEIGITANTAALIAQSTATDIDAGTIWLDTAPATVEALPSSQILVGGTDIIQTVGTANITAGAITYYCVWYPLSEDGNVAAT
jgi:hypothetical protein